MGGEKAYSTPYGPFVGGILYSITVKAKPLGFLINTASCETGYYAGVCATEGVLNLVQ